LSCGECEEKREGEGSERFSLLTTYGLQKTIGGPQVSSLEVLSDEVPGGFEPDVVADPTMRSELNHIRLRSVG
jgi:hypothetical protein